jgi:hypothetical protein
LQSHRCGAGDLHSVAFGIPVESECDGKFMESVLHLMFVDKNLSGEWHTVISKLGLRVVRRARIIENILQRTMYTQPPGIQQQDNGMDSNRGVYT